MEIKDLERKWNKMEKSLKRLIKTSEEPYKAVCQERLDNIKKMREYALLIVCKD